MFAKLLSSLLSKKGPSRKIIYQVALPWRPPTFPSNAASHQHLLNALAFTEQADKEATVNWKQLLQGETDEDYAYRQEGDAPGLVFSVVHREKQRRDLMHACHSFASAVPAAAAATFNAAGLVVAGNIDNDNIELVSHINDGGGEQEDEEMTWKNSEVSLLMPRHNGTTAATTTVNVGIGVYGNGGTDCGIGGCDGGHGCG